MGFLPHVDGHIKVRRDSYLLGKSLQKNHGLWQIDGSIAVLSIVFSHEKLCNVLSIKPQTRQWLC